MLNNDKLHFAVINDMQPKAALDQQDEPLNGGMNMSTSQVQYFSWSISLCSKLDECVSLFPTILRAHREVPASDGLEEV